MTACSGDSGSNFDGDIEVFKEVPDNIVIPANVDQNTLDGIKDALPEDTSLADVLDTKSTGIVTGIADDQVKRPGDMTAYQYIDSIEVKLSVSKQFNYGNLHVNNAIENFKPASSRSFLIEHADLAITDPLGNKYPLQMYLIPHKKSNSKRVFAIFFTLKGMGINTIRLNDSLTSLYTQSCQFSLPANNNLYGKDNLATSTTFNVVPSKWTNACIEFNHSTSEILHYPSPKKSPDYTNNGDADNRDTSIGITLQPLGPMNYLDIDWKGFDYTQDSISFKDGESITVNINDTHTETENNQTALIHSNTIMARQVAASKENHQDIGWLGMPEEVRSHKNFNRFHILNVKFIYEAPDSGLSATEISIPANGITIKRGTKSDVEGNQVNPITLSSPAKVLKYEPHPPTP